LVELPFLILELQFLILWWMELVRIDYEVILMVIERGAVRSGGDRVFLAPNSAPPTRIQMHFKRLVGIAGSRALPNKP
jgi:hypothetical protein